MRIRFVVVAVVTALAAGAPAVRADSRGGWMSDAELRTAFSGVTLEGKYGSGKSFSETYRADGRVAYQERGATIGGKWSVEAGTFCTIYDTDPTGGCYRVRQVSTNCFEFYFVARTEEKAHSEPGRPAWTARGSVTGMPGACRQEHSV